MRTKVHGHLNRILDDEARMQVGPFEYQVLITEATRRLLQASVGQELTLYLSEYLEGGQNATRLIPRLIGFSSETDLQFFDLFCTVDKIGVKKALRAMSRGTRDIAEAIHRQDAKWLTTLPGIGAATAEQIVTTLKRKVTGFAFAAGDTVEAVEEPPEPTAAKAKPKKKGQADTPPAKPRPTAKMVDDVYQALLGVGLNPQEARDKLDAFLQSGAEVLDAASAVEWIFKSRA